jgi:hypothetical protein
MEKDTLRMQFLSGIITEGQYKVKLQENENKEIAAKVEPILNKPEVEKKIEDIYSNLSDDEKKELESSLKKLGINASTSPKDAHDAVQNVADNVGGEMSEGDENIDPKKKVADILHTIGAGNLAAFGGAPVAVAIGSLLVGTVGSPFVVGLGISWGVSTLLVGLAKLLEKEPGSSNESLNESMIGGIVGIGAINQIPPRAKADYETAFEHFLGEKYGLNEVEEEVGEGKAVEEPSLYEGEVNENVGSTIDKILQTFEFSEKGNDDMIEFGNYLLSPEGPKNIAMSIKSKLKGEGGENYFTSKPEELDAFLSKLK